MELTMFCQAMAHISIRKKLCGGFGLILLILAAIVAVTLNSISTTQEEVDIVTHQIQPTLIASTALEAAVKQGAASMGLYLLTNEKAFKQTYQQDLAKIRAASETLKNTVANYGDQHINSLVDKLAGDVKKFINFEPETIRLSEDRLQNFPAMEYARANLNPINSEITQILTAMIESESSEEASDERKRLIITLSNLKGTWANVTINVRVFLYLNNDDAKANIKLFLGGVHTIMQKVKELDVELTFEQEEGISSLTGLVNKWEAGFNELAKIQNSDKARMDAYVIKTEIGPVLTSISQQLASLVNEQTGLTEKMGGVLSDHAASTNRLVTILLVVGLLVGGGVAWLITLIILNPLRQAASALDDIASGEGDLTQRLNAQGSDEISQLAGSFNHFAGRIQQLVQQVAETVQHLSRSAGDMSLSTARSNDMIETQRSETTEIATAITQMSATSHNVAQNAELAASAALNADNETNQSRAVFDKALDGVGILGRDLGETSAMIQVLGSDIQDIGSVIDMIRGITEQTNLLALNAAIEAARAGEQGRGFAVVADEVRSLANKTKQSTNEIQHKIEALQTQAATAVTRMLSNRDAANNLVACAATAGTSLQAISQAVTEITDMTREIASAAEQQSSVAEDVNRRVENVTNLADKVAAVSHDVSQDSDGLEQLSSNLKGLIGRFKY